MQTLDEIVAESPVFQGLEQDQLQLIAGCAHNAAFFKGERLFREGDAADTFYLVRRGRVALTTHVPARGDVSRPTRGISTRGRSRTPASSPSTAPACAASATPTMRSASSSCGASPR